MTEQLQNLSKKSRLLTGVFAFLAAVLGSSNAVGQEETARAGSEGSTYLEEVIVTAEKRAQNVQDVPVAISAFSASMLEARGIASARDLQFSVPALSVGEEHRGGNVKVYLRGVGNENVVIGGDPAVPVHIDGHYTQSTAYILRDMLDVERVEVLRGPQGTLYGRNAIGGSINIITKRPTPAFEGLISADMGNYDKRQIQAVISGPLNDRLRARIALSDEKHDGYVENISMPGDDRESADVTSVRGSLEFDLTEAIQLFVNAYYFDDKGNNAVRSLHDYPQTPTLGGGPNYYLLNNAGINPTASDPFKIRNNSPSRQTNKSKVVAFQMTGHLGAVELRWLGAFDSTDRTSINDTDGSDVVNGDEFWIQGMEVLTQELQLLSTGAGPAKWVVGLFYLEENSDLFYDYRVDNIFVVGAPRTMITAPLDVSAKSRAAYGQLDYSLTNRLDLVAGLRYTKDDKQRVESVFFGAEDGSPPFELPGTIHSGADDWSKATGKLGLNYHPKENALLYASWSRGYKSGGFNFTQESSYDPETLDAYEVGLKSEWLGRRVQLNLAAFYYDYRDKQDFQRIVAPPLILFEIRNASSATIKGMELEAQAYVTSSLLLDVAMAYQDAKFDKFTTVDGVFPELGAQDLAGNDLPFAPDLTVHVGAQYTWNLVGNAGSLVARADYSWVDDQWTNGLNRSGDGGLLVGNADFVPSSYRVNARLKWESADSSWQAELYARNLTDEVVQTNSYVDAGVLLGTFLPPRTYGLRVQYRF